MGKVFILNTKAVLYTESMFGRPLHQRTFTVPRGVTLPEAKPLPLENVSHTPGQPAAIRFFDPNSLEDLAAMREILKGKQVKKWMDDAQQISHSDYREWAGTPSKSSYLFAIHDARTGDPKDMKHVRGFVYIYSEREEKFRVKRMEKLHFIEPCDRVCYFLEISFAIRPLANGEQSGSGLMSSAIRQSCLQVRTLLTTEEPSDVEVFAFVDPGNIPAQRTLESSGFVKKGLMKYDWDSPSESCLYILNWRVLQRKIRQKLLEVVQKQEQT